MSIDQPRDAAPLRLNGSDSITDPVKRAVADGRGWIIHPPFPEPFWQSFSSVSFQGFYATIRMTKKIREAYESNVNGAAKDLEVLVRQGLDPTAQFQWALKRVGLQKAIQLGHAAPDDTWCVYPGIYVTLKNGLSAETVQAAPKTFSEAWFPRITGVMAYLMPFKDAPIPTDIPPGDERKGLYIPDPGERFGLA